MANYSIRYGGRVWHFKANGKGIETVRPNADLSTLRELAWQYLQSIGQVNSIIKIYRQDGTFDFGDKVAQ